MWSDRRPTSAPRKNCPSSRCLSPRSADWLTSRRTVVHLVALVQSADHVCCRYRLAAFRPALEAAGHSLELEPLPKRWWSRLLLFRRLRGACVIVQRFLLPAWQIAFLRGQADRLIFDFDDAVFLRDSYSRKGTHHPRRLRRFAATVQAADAVVA